MKFRERNGAAGVSDGTSKRLIIVEWRMWSVRASSGGRLIPLPYFRPVRRMLFPKLGESRCVVSQGGPYSFSSCSFWKIASFEVAGPVPLAYGIVSDRCKRSVDTCCDRLLSRPGLILAIPFCDDFDLMIGHWQLS